MKSIHAPDSTGFGGHKAFLRCPCSKARDDLYRPSFTFIQDALFSPWRAVQVSPKGHSYLATTYLGETFEKLKSGNVQEPISPKFNIPDISLDFLCLISRLG